MKKIFSTLLVLFLIISKQSYGDDSKQARDFINKVGQEIISTAKEDSSSLAKRSKIIKIIDDSINPEWIARFVLGINYRTANEDQRNRFTDLYRKFMINTYGPKFKDYDGESFEVTEVLQKKRIYLVKAEFVPSGSNVAILVDFRVKKNGDRFYILDFITEGISLIETQRSEFNSAISQKGMEGFLKVLSDRVTELKKVNKQN